MGAPTVYYYDDPGAPTLSNGQDAFYQIVRACLIDGYGSKPAAGWSVVYDDWAATGNASFENASRSGTLGVRRAIDNNAAPYLYIADAMIDVQTPIGARSGREGISNISQLSESFNGTQRAHKKNCHERWCVVANDNFAYVMMGVDDRVFDVNPGSYVGFTVLGFGAIKSYRGLGSLSSAVAGNFLIMGGIWTGASAARYNSYDDWDYNYTSTAYRDHNGLSLPSDSWLGLYPYSSQGQSNLPGAIVGSVVNARVYAVSVYVTSSVRRLDGAWQVGELPGLYANSMFAVTNNNLKNQIAYNAFRDQFLLSERLFVKIYLTNDVLGLLSLDAEDWI